MSDMQQYVSGRTHTHTRRAKRGTLCKKQRIHNEVNDKLCIYRIDSPFSNHSEHISPLLRLIRGFVLATKYTG